MILKFAIAILLSITTYAALPPSAYTNMKKNAPEIVTLHVTKVTVLKRERGDREITVRAEVTRDERTRSGLRSGETITLKYVSVSHRGRGRGYVGPKSIPVPTEQRTYKAYLSKIPDLPIYRPAAGAASFVR